MYWPTKDEVDWQPCETAMISSGAARGTVRHGMHALQKAHLAVRAPFHQHAQRQGSSWRLRHAQSCGCNTQVAQRDPRSHLLKAVPTHSALLHHTRPALQDREGPSGNEGIGMKLAWQPRRSTFVPVSLHHYHSHNQPHRRYNWDCWSSRLS